MGVVGKIHLKKTENQKFELSKGAAAGQGGWANPAWGFPCCGLRRRGTAGQEQCELALGQMNMRAKIKGASPLPAFRARRAEGCSVHWAESIEPCPFRTLDVLQPDLSRDRNSTARSAPSVCPFSQIPQPCFFHHFPGLCHHLPCRLLPLLDFSSLPAGNGWLAWQAR